MFLIRNLAISTSQNILSNDNEEEKEEILFRERRSLNFYQTGHKLQVNLCQKLFFLQNMGENMLCAKIVLNVRNNFRTQHVLPKFELGIFMYALHVCIELVI